MAKDSKRGGKTAPVASRARGSLARFWAGLMKDLFDPYRPERATDAAVVVATP